MTKYFVDSDGNYKGGYDGAAPPTGLTEIPAAPADYRDKWINGAWVAYTPEPPLTDRLNALFQKLSTADQLQYFPYFGGIFALLTQGQNGQVKTILSAIPVSEAAAGIRDQMLALIP